MPAPPPRMIASTLSVESEISVLSEVEEATSALTATARVVRVTCSGIYGEIVGKAFGQMRSHGDRVVKGPSRAPSAFVP